MNKYLRGKIKWTNLTLTEIWPISDRFIKQKYYCITVHYSTVCASENHLGQTGQQTLWHLELFMDYIWERAPNWIAANVWNFSQQLRSIDRDKSPLHMLHSLIENAIYFRFVRTFLSIYVIFPYSVSKQKPWWYKISYPDETRSGSGPEVIKLFYAQLNWAFNFKCS